MEGSKHPQILATVAKLKPLSLLIAPKRKRRDAGQAEVLPRRLPQTPARDLSVLQTKSGGLRPVVRSLVLRRFHNHHYRRKQTERQAWEAAAGQRSHPALLVDLGVPQPETVLLASSVVGWRELGSDRVRNVRVNLGQLLATKIGRHDTSGRQGDAALGAGVLRRPKPGCDHLSKVQRPELGKGTACGSGQASAHGGPGSAAAEPAEMLTPFLKMSERNKVRLQSKWKGRAYLCRVFAHCNRVRTALNHEKQGLPAVVLVRRCFGCLTAKNIQHLLIRYQLRDHCASPALVGPGAQRGLMHLCGRSRLALYRDRTAVQILQCREDLELGRKKMFAVRCLESAVAAL